MAADALVRPARELPATRLVELTGHLRRALAHRGEPLAPAWPEVAADRLRSGELEGWVAEDGGRPIALSMLSEREARGYGHLHVEEDPQRLETARRLATVTLDRLGPGVRRVDFGVTGLPEAEERELGRSLRARKGFEFVERYGLRRPLSLDAPPVAPALPEGSAFHPVAIAPLSALDALDRRSFEGGPDESLLSETPEGNRRVLERILEGELGRFLPEASFVVLEGDALVAFLLTTEENARSATFADLAVDPSHRRRGVGSALLGRGLRALLALGYGEARLWVTAANTPARELYRAMGFERDRTTFIYRWRAPA